ncbi:ligand-gated channel [Bacteroidia bacterium]|nr:ligand-gated channel [Bacteroidia bacterium]
MDSTQIKVLDEVEVRANRPPTFQSTSPTQVLQANDWTKFGASQVSDAVKHFSGVQVKDYGGVGGLKTVSLRSLGANHTGVVYDGVPVTDMQTGQIDLGRFSLNFVDLLSLTIGESDFLLQTAQAQALAGALSITTGQGIAGQARNDIRAAVNVGSFGLLNPSVMYGKSLSGGLSLTVIGDYLRTDGNYPFTQRIGTRPTHRKRLNSDVETFKMEANLNGKFKNGGRMQFKTGFYGSGRGLPGSAIYYNDYAGERLKNREVFSQIHLTQPISKRLDMLANAKVHFFFIDYKNYLYGTQTKYYQSALYLNATLRYKFSETIALSWANDVQGDNFSKQDWFANAKERATWLSALAGQYANRTFTLTAKLLNTYAVDEYHHLSPYVGLSVRPLQNLPVRLRAFYKNSYRLPTLGDLNYGTVPALLKPESANQIDVGLTVATAFGEKIPYLSFSGDVYKNRVRDKIVAIPRGSMVAWSMQNIGKVDITGVDVNLATQIPVGTLRATPLQINIAGTYTFQDAVDKTDRTSPRYNNQIPFSARHSASGVLGVQTPWLNINYNVLYCGQRYHGHVNQPTNRMPAFAEHGISAQRKIKTKHLTWTLSGECKNLFNTQYEVVNNYPMSGRSWILRVKVMSNEIINLNYIKK